MAIEIELIVSFPSKNMVIFYMKNGRIPSGYVKIAVERSTLWMGKSTISTGSCSKAMFQYQRVTPEISWDERFAGKNDEKWWKRHHHLWICLLFCLWNLSISRRFLPSKWSTLIHVLPPVALPVVGAILTLEAPARASGPGNFGWKSHGFHSVQNGIPLLDDYNPQYIG